MSSIMRWRNGLMGLSVMAITPVSHEVSEPHDLETGRAILFIPTSNPPRTRSRRGVYRESGLVLGRTSAVELPGLLRPQSPLTRRSWQPARGDRRPAAHESCQLRSAFGCHEADRNDRKVCLNDSNREVFFALGEALA